jgi:hypothetical protein
MTKLETDQKFNGIRNEAEKDPNIIAFWLAGSRGKGMVTQFSDYDCVMIVKDGVLDEYKKKYYAQKTDDIEFWVMTLQEFRDHASWGSQYAWDRYNYAHIKSIVDKTDGEIEKLFLDKSVIPKDKIKEAVSGYLDAYINQIYRSLKCFRDGNPVASQLEANESIPWLFSSLFGLEGRLRPYYKYIQWEFKNYPLKHMPWEPDQLLEKVLKIIRTGDIQTQQELLKSIEPIFREKGYSEVLDGWEKKLDWMKIYES